MKGLKKHFIIILLALSAIFALTACGNRSSQENDSAVEDSATENSGQSWLSPGKFGSADNTIANTNDTVNTEESTAQQNAGESGNGTDGAAKDVADETGDMEDTADDVADDAEDIADDAEDIADDAEDIADDAEDVADDVADGIGDAIDNLGGGSFDRYEDAREYLLGRLQKDNEAAHYEFREETEDLTAYNSNDSGAEGYQFSVYETDGNEKIGIYYVDKDTGKIYRYMGKDSIEAY